MPSPLQNPYLDLTHEFNHGRLRAIVSSGQAVVLHRLAIASKDGDWIIREDAEAMDHILRVLESRGARYRFGAPLDPRWLRSGWSAHLEHLSGGLRIRTDFVTRPPRITAADLADLWRSQEGRQPPVVDARRLALIKMTDREKDWPVIGELARLLSDPKEQLQFSRSVRDIWRLLKQHPGIRAAIVAARPALAAASGGEEALAAALDAERREMIRANETRLGAYEQAGRRWRAAWPGVEKEMGGVLLRAAHAIMVRRAELLLPFEVAHA